MLQVRFLVHHCQQVRLDGALDRHWGPSSRVGGRCDRLFLSKMKSWTTSTWTIVRCSSRRSARSSISSSGPRGRQGSVLWLGNLQRTCPERLSSLAQPDVGMRRPRCSTCIPPRLDTPGRTLDRLSRTKARRLQHGVERAAPVPELQGKSNAGRPTDFLATPPTSPT